MIEWWWLLVAIPASGFFFFILCALICSGRMADQDEIIGYWRRQCIKMCERYKIDLPLGPGEIE